MKKRTKRKSSVLTLILLGSFAVGGLGLMFSITWLISVGLVVFAFSMLLIVLTRPDFQEFGGGEMGGNGGIGFGHDKVKDE
tara:strand:+ start:425 stop:667 length:243 start_codon:yes stop_codon:yes gene_type:complete